MRKLFFSAIPICLVSFILFGISVAILGTRYETTVNSGVYDGSYDYSDRYQYICETVTRGEWTFTDAVKPDVSLHTSGVNAYVVQSNDDYIHIRVASKNSSSVRVNVYTEDDTLNIEVCPPNIIFDGEVNFGRIFWLDDIFHGSPDTEVVISFPQLIYDDLDIEHGSGTLMVDGLNAKYNDFDIGSGRFEFSKSDQFTAERFDVDVGSGSTVISNMQTNRYQIELGSGHYDLSGLSGSGEIDMGSGKGSIAYSGFVEFENDNGYDYETEICELDMGSGTLDLYFPDNSGCQLYTYIGSGSVNVNAYGIEKKLTQSSDENELTLGENSNTLYYNINMGSGKINIRNTSEYTASALFEGRPDVSGVITGITISSEGETTVNSSSSSVNADVIEQATITTGTAEFSSGEVTDTSLPQAVSSVSKPAETPEAPEASEAPEAPEALEAPKAPEAPEAPEATDAPAA